MTWLYSVFLTLRLLAGLLAGLRAGIATNFWPVNDPGNPSAWAACIHRDLKVTDMVVAHPTLPCMSRVLVYSIRTRRSVIARVGDRGPRHALVDLAPATARALRANGWEQVFIIPLPLEIDMIGPGDEH